MKSARAITFDARPSRRLAQTLAVGAAVALAAILSSGLPWRVLSGSVFALFAVAALRRHCRTGAWRVAWREDGTWSVAALGDASADEASLAGWSTLGCWLVLRLRLASGRRVALVLLPDNAVADVRRRLVVRLQRQCVVPADVSLLP